MKPSRIRRLALLAAGPMCVAALLAVALSGAAQAAGHGGRWTVPGSRPSWTSAAPQAGAVPASQHVDARVWLAPQNADQLDALATAVSDPSSAQYGQFLTEDQYDAQFAPSADQVSAISQWLTSSGLQVVTTGPDSHYIGVDGSADAIQAAFGTTLANYVVDGKQVQAPTGDVTVPDQFAGQVLAVTGLNTLNAIKPADFGAPAAYVNGTPCGSYYGQQQASNLPRFKGRTLPYAVCGYTPKQFRSVYGAERAGNGGAGVTVAIVDAYDAPTLRSDANTYAQRQGDRPFFGNQFQDRSVPEDATTEDECGGNGWYGEQTLDVEAVHGMAPSANVLYYGASSCKDDDLLASLAQIVADNKASIVSDSWGEPTFVMQDGVEYITIDQATVDAYESVFKQGAVQGIGFYFSSGDDGDEMDAYGVASPDWPAEDPWVTSVGGTSLAVDRFGHRQFETGWGTDKWTLSTDGHSWQPIDPTDPFLYGAGGGISQIFDEPSYQQGVLPRGTSGRGVPDVAMDADPTTGMLVGETQSFSDSSRFGPAGVHYGEYRIGGTSLASPLFAGAQAVAQTRRRIGFANPTIYNVDRLTRGQAFYDVTPEGDLGNVRADYTNGLNASGGYTYSVRTFDQDSSLTTNRGWDDVTGVGSVTPLYLSLMAGLR